ncbi:hypothetical protein JCM3765_002064 [Sporobolomyces pararoseus]
MKAVLLFFLIVAVIQQAAGWRKNSKTSDQDILQVGKEDLQQFETAQDVLAAFDSNSDSRNVAPELPSSSSCFFLALKQLPTSSPCESLAHSDSQRSEIAVRMALCEIGSAQSARTPKECLDWEQKRGQVAFCVEALSRSPQYWASYSGYLREIVTHCSTFRRWADIELARDLHKASTSILHDFVSRLKRYEETRSRRQDAEVHRTQDQQAALASLLLKLQSLASNFDQIQQGRELRLTTLQTGLETVSSDLQNLPEVLKVALSQLARRHEDSLREILQRNEAALVSTVDLHRDHLRSALEDLNEGIRSTFKDLTEAVASVSSELTVLKQTSQSAKDIIIDAQQVSYVLHKFTSYPKSTHYLRA